MAAWRTRRLDHVEFPYVFADATYLKGRVNGQVVSRAVVVVTGVAMTGEREVLGCAVGDTETEAFWAEFLRSLRARGLTGVRLVISDHHTGLKTAIAKCFVGAAWCYGHLFVSIARQVSAVLFEDALALGVVSVGDHAGDGGGVAVSVERRGVCPRGHGGARHSVRLSSLPRQAGT